MSRKDSADGPGDYTQLFDMLEDQHDTSLLDIGPTDTAPLPEVEWEPPVAEPRPAPKPSQPKAAPKVTQTAPAPVPAPPARDPMVIIIAALVSFIILACGAVLTWVLMSNKTPPTVVQPTVTVTETVTTTTTVTQTPPPPPTTESDQETVALASLTAQLQADAGIVQQSLQNRWTTQLSARKLGLVTGGLEWTYQGIWDEFTNLRDSYPEALLVQANSYRSFNLGSEWYVVVSGLEFHNANEALHWCDNQGLDDDCFAVRVTNDRGNNSKRR